MEILEDKYLQSMRQVADPIADNTINSLLQHKEITELKDVFKNLVYNREIDTDKMPEAIKEYFTQNEKLPDFANIGLINKAQSAFAKFGPSIILAYFHKSLPECYACGMGAEVLGMTGRLTNHTRRRVAQTAQFVMDVMTPGGLNKNGKGISSALKVRLVHASIRYYLKKSVEEGKESYDYNKMGKPINQEDLVGTMLAFSVVVIQGVEKLGVKVQQEEKEAILHLWKVVGYMIGIKEEIMPKDFQQAEQLWAKITSRLYAKTNAGIQLNNHLIEMLQEIIPKHSYDGIVYLLMNHLIDDKAKIILDVKTNYQHRFLTLILGFILDILLKFDSNSRFSRYFTNHLNLILLNELKSYVSENESIDILVPPGLHSDWEDNHDKSDKILGIF
ncbi:oxygenase MpaB family protein [Candidatus Kapabacteria bacterium]|nr:oxygenase MpaB family protein [Candidatus Kapabacteria bacterium]